jgi:hypothetical protein
VEEWANESIKIIRRETQQERASVCMAKGDGDEEEGTECDGPRKGGRDADVLETALD